jgi:hypothetical protein
VKLKDVAFADGQLRFRIPSSWVQSQEEDGGGVYYDEKLDQGTLRVKVMTFTTEDDLTGHRALDEMGVLEAEPGQTLEALANGNAVRFHREETEASGERTAFHVWLLASLDPPHRMRLAVFSFTVRAREAEEATALLGVLDTEIRQARFAHQVS